MVTGQDEALIAAIDIGTTRVKGALYSWRGTAGAARAVVVDVPLAPLKLDGLAAEQDPNDLLAAARHVVDALVRKAPPSRWRALALTTQRGTLMPIGKDGTPAHGLLSWLDRRGTDPASGRWAWFVKHAPEVVARTAWLASLQSWLVFSLTGERLDTAQTQPPEVARAGDDPAGRPTQTKVVSPGHAVAIGDTALARAWQLPPGLKLVMAGGDKNSELVGAGGTTPGRGVVSFGTAVSLGCLLEKAPAAPLPGVYQTPAHLPGATQAEVGLPYGGGVWAWLAGLFPQAVAALTDADLTEAAPLFLPYMAGSLLNPLAAAAWHGLTPATTPGTLVASGLEGILFDLRAGVARLPKPPSELALTGGGRANASLAQGLADVLGVPVMVAAGEDAGTAGAAAAAAVATGLAPDWLTATAALAVPPMTAYATRSHEAKRAAARFARWRALTTPA